MKNAVPCHYDAEANTNHPASFTIVLTKLVQNGTISQSFFSQEAIVTIVHAQDNQITRNLYLKKDKCKRNEASISFEHSVKQPPLNPIKSKTEQTLESNLKGFKSCIFKLQVLQDIKANQCECMQQCTTMLDSKRSIIDLLKLA